MVELLRKAIESQALLESGEVAHQAEFARRARGEGTTRARVTQVMGMLRLGCEIRHMTGPRSPTAARYLRKRSSR